LKFRKKNRMSQKQLSILMGCSNSTLWGVENTLDPVGYSTVKAFERVVAEFDKAEKLRLQKVPRVAAKTPRFNRGAA